MITSLHGRRIGAHRVAVLVVAMLLCACTGSSASGGRTPAAAPVTATPLTGEIAFAGHMRSDQRHQQIYVERADGSKVRQLVRSDASDTDPALSPDGRRLVFTRRVPSKPDRIFMVKVDGTELRPLLPANCPGVCSDAVEGSPWSPDSHSLVFTRAVLQAGSMQPATVELWLTNIDGSAAHRVTKEPAVGAGDTARSQDGFAGWAPDGTRIVFTHRERGTAPSLDQFAVFTVRPDGTNLRQLTPNDIEAGEAVWSPDGTLIAFLSPPDAEDIPKVLYTMRPDGSDRTGLTNNLDGNDSENPSWSPDSSRIAFSHVVPGSPPGADLYVVDRDGGQLRPITVTPLSEAQPSWAVESS